jgi:uncharacterized protein (DUF952 family)
VSEIYKVLRVGEWEAFSTADAFAGSADDLRDGFVHLSTGEQLRATVEKHFADEDYLVLLAVDAEALGEKLKWEPSRGGALFPHLYGALPMSAVLRFTSVQRDEEDEPVFPPEIP